MPWLVSEARENQDNRLAEWLRSARIIVFYDTSHDDILCYAITFVKRFCQAEVALPSDPSGHRHS